MTMNMLPHKLPCQPFPGVCGELCTLDFPHLLAAQLNGQPGIILGFSIIDAERRSLFFSFLSGSTTCYYHFCMAVQAATGCHSGEIILWSPWLVDPDGKRYRMAAKIIQIHSRPVHALSAVDRFLVSGADDGYIRLFDRKLRLVAWFEVRWIPNRPVQHLLVSLCKLNSLYS